jgi:hypothetical protein
MRENLIKKELDLRRRLGVPTITPYGGYFNPNAIRFIDVSLVREPTDENCRIQEYVFDHSNEEFDISFSSSFSE